jgi:GT2 family glycosyltransferase
VIVAYHRAEDVNRCLESLGSSVDATVVDNSSSEPVRRAAETHAADYVDAGSNRGFAGAVNIGLGRAANGGRKDVLLVNPDALVEPEAIHELMTFLHRPEHARVAAVSPRLVDPAGAEQRVKWPYPSPVRAWLQAAGMGDVRPGAGFAVGAVLLLRAEALADVGFFDERFFLYAEEADWQRRAARLGWHSKVCCSAVAIHAGAGSSRDEMRREALFHAGQETYIRKWYGEPGWLAYWAGVVAGASVRTVLLRGERRAEARRRAKLYLHGPRRSARLGPV